MAQMTQMTLPKTGIEKPLYFDENVAKGWPPLPELLEPFHARDVRLYGPKIKADVLFYEEAAGIYNDTGMDLYAGQSTWDHPTLPKFDWKVQHKTKTVRFKRPDDGQIIEAAIDVPYHYAVKLEDEELSEEELLQKRQHQAALARAAKAAYRADDRSDEPRFGFCKRRGCENRKVRTLVRRSLCPECLQKPAEAVAAKPTVTERRQRVLEARQAHPEASLRELAKLTGLSKDTVQRFLRTGSVSRSTA
jgi:hypothetical protein